MITTTIIDCGEVVACDFCNEGEDTLGGGMISTYAICGDCLADVQYPEEIDEVFPTNKTFRENVLNYRREHYGNTNAIIQIGEFEWR